MNETESNIDDLQLPPSLQGELDRLYGLTPSVSQEVDASILNEARAGLARRMRFRRAVSVSAGLAASAAAVVLAIHLAHVTAPPPTSLIAQNLPGDIDHSGRVDILDAYVLARGLQTHRQTQTGADFNHDGKTDAADVEAIASAAVRLPEGVVQ